MKKGSYKLKHKLVFVNTLSKVLIISVFVILLPFLVQKISIRETDNQLIEKLDKVYSLLEEFGVEAFLNQDNSNDAFGSYNIFKEEYISIEMISDTSLYEQIEYTKREVEGEIYDYRVISATFEYTEDYYLIEIGQSISSIINFEKELKQFALYFLVIILGITIIIDSTFIQLLLKPFDHLVKKLKRSGYPASFDYSDLKTSTSDFIYLEENLHALMRKIESAFNEEREYIGNISHELLTPISVIKSKLENFVNQTDLKDDEIVKIIESKISLGRLTKMVRTLLLMSRIENEEYLMNEYFTLNEFVENLCDEFAERAQHKNLSFKQDIFTEIEFNVKANKELLNILLINLFNNSYKYTKEGGEIELKLYVRDHSPVIEIRDTGIGISNDQLPHIFSRFKKFQDGNNNYGLGLSIAKKICDYHKIKIEVSSKLEVGTSFYLYFSEFKS